MQKSESIPLCPENPTDLSCPMSRAEKDDAPTGDVSDIEFSNSMILMLESLKDDWSTTMKTLLTNKEERVERLEQGFAAVNSSSRRIESLNLKTQVEYQRLNSIIQKTEDILPDLCA